MADSGCTFLIILCPDLTGVTNPLITYKSSDVVINDTKYRIIYATYWNEYSVLETISLWCISHPNQWQHDRELGAWLNNHGFKPHRESMPVSWTGWRNWGLSGVWECICSWHLKTHWDELHSSEAPYITLLMQGWHKVLQKSVMKCLDKHFIGQSFWFLVAIRWTDFTIETSMLYLNLIIYWLM